VQRDQRPHGLDNAHMAMDVAVVAAYGKEDHSPAMPDV
jgi:hypothetical protein